MNGSQLKARLPSRSSPNAAGVPDEERGSTAGAQQVRHADCAADVAARGHVDLAAVGAIAVRVGDQRPDIRRRADDRVMARFEADRAACRPMTPLILAFPVLALTTSTPR